MNKDRLRDMALGFVLCLALMGSYYCGSMSPTNANATAADVSNFAVVGGVWDQWLTYVIVDKSTGLIRKSESIHEVDLRTISGDERYW